MLRFILIRKNEEIVVEIKDNGIGVPPDNIDRIFDRFYRETGTGEEGSGLGLAIVTEIVRLHNGKIFAKNNPYKGITVTVRIPIEHNNIVVEDENLYQSQYNFIY